MAVYIDPPDMAFGTFANPLPAPRLVDLPEGARAKLRFRPDELAKAFVRHANGDFSAWVLSCVNPKERTYSLKWPIGQNVRIK